MKEASNPAPPGLAATGDFAPYVAAPTCAICRGLASVSITSPIGLATGAYLCRLCAEVVRPARQADLPAVRV